MITTNYQPTTQLTTINQPANHHFTMIHHELLRFATNDGTFAPALDPDAREERVGGRSAMAQVESVKWWFNGG